MSGAHPAPSWHFLVDENLPRSLVPDLTALGYVAEHVYDMGMGGAKDPDVYGYAQGTARDDHHRRQGLQ